MVQICPYCHKTLSDEDTSCPHCGNKLPTDSDWINNKKQYYARINRVYILGFALLFSAIGYWLLESKGYFTPNWLTGGLFAVAWLVGFVLFCVYLRKGDNTFAWIG